MEKRFYKANSNSRWGGLNKPSTIGDYVNAAFKNQPSNDAKTTSKGEQREGTYAAAVRGSAKTVKPTPPATAARAVEHSPTVEKDQPLHVKRHETADKLRFKATTRPQKVNIVRREMSPSVPKAKVVRSTAVVRSQTAPEVRKTTTTRLRAEANANAVGLSRESSGPTSIVKKSMATVRARVSTRRDNGKTQNKQPAGNKSVVSAQHTNDNSQPVDRDIIPTIADTPSTVQSGQPAVDEIGTSDWETPSNDDANEIDRPSTPTHPVSDVHDTQTTQACLPVISSSSQQQGNADGVEDDEDIANIAVPIDAGASQQLSTGADSVVMATVAKQKRRRPCLFCSKFESRVEKHLIKKHPTEPQVLQILKMPSGKLRNDALKLLKREGIKKHNLKQLTLPNPVLETERGGTQTSDFSGQVLCGNCGGFFKRSYFRRHKKECVPTGTSATAAAATTATEKPIGTPVSMLLPHATSVSQAFQDDVLVPMRHDEIGHLCRSDTTIRLVGSRLFDKLRKKPDKRSEVIKSVRSDMRRLARLYTTFRQVVGEVRDQGASDDNTDTNSNSSGGQASDIFNRTTMPHLEEAIRRITEDEVEADAEVEEMKAGLKIGLFYLIIKAGDILKASFLVKRLDAEADELDRFLKLFRSNENTVFGSARWQLSRNQQMKLRLPEQLPQEEDVKQMRDYTVDRISEVINDSFIMWTPSLFLEIRDLVICRLTMFNARRGGEPARLQLRDWQAGKDDKFVDKNRVQRLDDFNRRMFGQLKVCYQMGKGNKLAVPLLVPNDSMGALDRLTDPATRLACSIRANNKFVFPSTQGSAEHTSGWHAVHKIAVAANVSNPAMMTATKNRHRVSTLYAGLDVPENDRQYFYKHMGHSAAVNADIYQTPLAVAEITKVGVRLQQMDGACPEIPTCSMASSTMSHADHDDVEPTVDYSSHVNDASTSSSNTMTAGRSKRRSANSDDDDNYEPNTDELQESPSPAKKQKTMRVRKFTRWSSDNTTLVRSYFRDYVAGSTLPGKSDILAFKNANPQIDVDWQTVRNKVVNEQMAAKKRQSQLLHQLNDM